MTEMARRAKGIMVFSSTTIYGEVGDVGIPGSSVETIDTTSQNNVGNTTTSQPGWITNGQLTFRVNDIGSSEQTALYTQLNAGTKSTWTVVYPIAFTRAYYFTGYVSNVKPAAPMRGGLASFDVTVTASGAISTMTSAATGLTTPFLSVTDAGSTGLTLSPTAANATYEYYVTTAADDTGVKITATNATSGEVIYINNTLTASGVASSAITIDTSVGGINMIPVVTMDSPWTKVPKIYWIRVLHGAT